MDDSDLQNNQCYITSIIEQQSCSAEPPDGSQTEARMIMDAAGDVIIRMGYKLVTGSYQYNKGHFHTIARFRGGWWGAGMNCKGNSKQGVGEKPGSYF